METLNYLKEPFIIFYLISFIFLIIAFVYLFFKFGFKAVIGDFQNDFGEACYGVFCGFIMLVFAPFTVSIGLVGIIADYWYSLEFKKFLTK